MSHPRIIPYSEEIRKEDTETAIKTVQPTLYPDEAKPQAIDFKGTCPRCGDPIDQREWLFAIAGALKLNDQQRSALVEHLISTGVDLAKGDYTFDLTCSCTASHPHRPTDKMGCGARFRVRVKWP